MNIRNEKNNIFNLTMAKLTGVYQIIDPGAVKFRGRNIYHIGMACVLLYMWPLSIVLSFTFLYYLLDNIPVSIDFLWKSVMLLFITYKGWLVVRHSDDIWNCFSITRYDFSSFSNQKSLIVDRWRKRFVWLTTIYSVIFLTGLLIFGIIPLAFNDYTLIKNHDGSIKYYRQNIVNLYLIVSEETYEANYYVFYFVELLLVLSAIVLTISFDNLLFLLCIGLCCQMDIICSAFASFGHKSLRDTHPPIENQDENKKITHNEHNILIYDELKKIIKDHQAVMEKYEDFLTIFRLIILLHIIQSSLMVILFWFTFIMGLYNVEIFQTSGDMQIRMFYHIPMIFIQLFIVCYLFTTLHNQKDSIIFALYSSNWTEMDMKCKKLILLTMQLNNANHKELKFTRTKIVNLEMFFKTMGDCYTVISVLVNFIQKLAE